MNDEYNLQRFIEAQESVYDDAVDILRRGMMCTPYMEFVFPRLAGIEQDAEPNVFAIGSLDEARAYLEFPVLGNRYRECVKSLSWLADRSVGDVFSSTDTRKLHASLTLFAEASNELLLRTMLIVWFDNLVDEDTNAQIQG